MRVEIEPGAVVHDAMRLAPERGRPADPLPTSVDRPIIDLRRAEADEFYDAIHPPQRDRRGAQHPAPGLRRDCSGRSRATCSTSTSGSTATIPTCPPPAERQHGRNARWRHLNSMRILSMPDKWEYPWFAAWDLAFHTVVFALIDAQFAKEQLWLMLFEQFQHPNGQIPAYEWEFSDLNPPVHAWAVWRVYNMDRIRNGGRPAVPREVLPQADAEFHLVGEQGRPRREQRLRRRLPRPRQHHRLRPQRDASRRRVARAERRHRLDGDVLAW